MPPLEHARPIEQSAHASTQQSGFHVELGSIWGMPQQIQDFSAGVGEGLAGAIKEGVQAVGQAVTHPSETISHAAKETVNAVKTTITTTVAVGEYIGDHAARGDMQGAVHDAQKLRMLYHT